MIRVRGAKAGAACVQTGQCHPKSGIALLRPVSGFAGVGREGMYESRPYSRVLLSLGGQIILLNDLGEIMAPLHLTLGDGAH